MINIFVYCKDFPVICRCLQNLKCGDVMNRFMRTYHGEWHNLDNITCVMVMKTVDDKYAIFIDVKTDFPRRFRISELYDTEDQAQDDMDDMMKSLNRVG